MKKIFYLLIMLIIILFIIFLMQNKKNSNNANNIEIIPFSTFNFYKKDNYLRYKKYQLENPYLEIKDIVLRVNIGLDHSFYTETKEITEFNTLMLINKYNYVTENFVPKDLIKVNEFAKDEIYLNNECATYYIKMALDAKEMGYNLRIISAYRTLEYQENLYNNYVKQDGINVADTYSARPGFSEHHTGLAIDIDNTILSYTNFENTKEFDWVINNAYKYGFILRYPKKEDITGYIYEPWHFRYVGIEAASYIHEHNITFEEYYYEFLDK